MALFKILKGLLARLPNTSKLGYAYYTTDKGKFYIFNSATLRRTLNPDIKITIGNQTKTSTTLSPEVVFDLASIGAAAADHNHDNRYLKLSGGTMTGDIIFTNKDANRLIWTDEDKKVSTTGHYATSDRVAINSTSEPGYNLLVNGTTLFQGETVTRIVRPEETKKYSLGTDDYKWSALYVSGNAQIDGSIKNLAVNGGIYWNPYVESTGDASDAASIEVIKAGASGGTLLRIQQQNDANDVVNIVTNATTGFKHNGHTVWDDTNDGPGSGADADLLDGCHGSYLPSPNTYVRREDNGYTKQNYILYTPNKGLNPSIGSFIVTNTGDNYLRFATKTNVVNQLAESPGTLINNNGHTYSITVTGDANTYYPVVIDTPLEKEAINYVSIWKNLGSQTATYTGNHDSGTSSMWLIYEVRKWLLDGNGGYLKCWYYSMPYANLCATTSAVGSDSGKLVVYLRGGGTSYNISTTYKSSVSVYYQLTNLGDSSYPVRVSPTTSISNRGKCSTTFLGYGDIAGNADTSTIPLGFASRNTNATWGNQTGTTITCWNLSSGGSVEFRRNNPSNGKLSIKVNGRFYGNEGNYPAMLIRLRNNYWGLGNPDGDDSDLIRTTVNGLIPFQSGGQGNGHSALGTSSWYFKEAFIDNINGTNLYLHGQTANRLVWLNGSKMLDTAGHYASGSKIAVNSTSEPEYNFYVNGNSYFTGTIRAKTVGSSWIDGLKRTDRSALLVTDATDSDSYWPWISHHNTSSKRYFSLGQLANSIYLIGTTDTRTTDGYDYGWQFDFSNGVMTVPGNIQPVSTNTQTLGTSSLRWAEVYIGTADTYGSTTKGVYWNAGVPTAMTYELKSTVNSGAATRIAYYSGTNAVSSGSIVTDGSYLHDVSSLYVTKNDWEFALGHNYTNQDAYLSASAGGISIHFLHTDVGQTYTWIRPDFIQIGKKTSDGDYSTTILTDNASGSITANGTIKAGSKLQLWTDGLGGNIDIIDNSSTRHYQFDAFDGNLRLYSQKCSDDSGYLGITLLDTDGNTSLNGSLWVSQNNATGGGIHLADDGGFYDFNNGFGTAAFSNGLIVARGKDQNNTAVQLDAGGQVRAYSSGEAQLIAQADNGRNLYLFASQDGRLGLYSNPAGLIIEVDTSNNKLFHGGAQQLLINGVTWNSNWNWSGQGGQPAWLWGSNDGSNMYVWNPSNFSVDSADHLRGTHGHTIRWGWTGHKLLANVDGVIIRNWDPTWPSDRRLKKNIKDISDRYLKAIGKINLVQFNYNQKSYIFNDNLLHFGAIAQDIMNSLHLLGLNESNSNLILKTLINKNLYYEIDYTSFLILRIAYDLLKFNKLIQLLKQLILKLKSLIQLLNAKLDTLVVSHL